MLRLGGTTMKPANKVSGAIMRLALLKTELTGISQILTPRLKTSNTGTWIDRHRSRWIIPLGDTSVAAA
jgi:hypothetical protein